LHIGGAENDVAAELAADTVLAGDLQDHIRAHREDTARKVAGALVLWGRHGFTCEAARPRWQAACEGATISLVKTD
jgi:hypothetical protein